MQKIKEEDTMEKTADFTEGRILSRLLRFALPVLAALFLQAMYGAVDLMVVGQFGAPTDVSAVSTGSQIMQTVTSLITGLAMGITILVGQKIGEKRPEQAGDVIGSGICLFGVLAAVLTVLMILGAGFLAGLMHAPDEAFSQTVDYIRICSAGAVFIIAYNVLGSIFRGIGDSRMPLFTVAAACVFNIGGDLLLVAGFHMGAAGAALATVFGTVIACLMSILSVMKRDNFVSIPFIIKEKVRVTLEPAKNMFKVASSVFVEQIFMRIGFLTVSIMVAKLGTDAFAAHQVGMNVMSLSFSFGDGMQVAAVALCGRSLGEKRPDLAQMYGTICQRIGNMISIVLAVLYTTLGTWYFHLFFDEPHLVAMGVEITRVLTFIVLLQIAQVIYMGCLRGAGDVVFTTIASTISITFVRPILSYVFCYACGLGLVGIWLGILGDQTSRLLLTTWRFKSGRWMKIEI